MGDYKTLDEAELRERDHKYLHEVKQVEKDIELHTLHIKGCVIKCKQKDRLEQYEQLLSKTKINKK